MIGTVDKRESNQTILQLTGMTCALALAHPCHSQKRRFNGLRMSSRESSSQS